MPADESLKLTDDLHAPAHARAWLTAKLSHLPTPVVEDALLLASELVTNAVRHGRPDILIAVTFGSDVVRLEVHDGGESLPVVPSRQPSPDRPTGRGLLIVAATASDWGVERRQDSAGKVVWVSLAHGTAG